MRTLISMTKFGLLTLLVVVLFPCSAPAQRQGFELGPIEKQIARIEKDAIRALEGLRFKTKQEGRNETLLESIELQDFALSQIAKLKPDVPEVWLALANVEVHRRKYGAPDCDLEKAKTSLEKHLALKSDSVEGHLMLAQVLGFENQTEPQLEHLQKAFELDVHTFDQYCSKIAGETERNEFLDKVVSRIERLITKETFNSNEISKFVKTLQKIGSFRTDVSKELRLHGMLKSASSHVTVKNNLDRLEKELGPKQAHFFFSNGDIENQLLVLNETVVRQFVEAQKSGRRDVKLRIGETTQNDLLRVVLEHPGYAARAREIFDPFEKRVYAMAARPSRTLANYLEKIGKHPDIERELRRTVFRSDRQPENAIELMRSCLDASIGETWSVVRAFEESKIARKFEKAKPDDQQHPKFKSDLVDAIPRPHRKFDERVREISPEVKAEFYFLRGRLAMNLEHFGTAVHYFKKAVAMAEQFPESKMPDARKYLKECIAKSLDENWNGPNTVFPERSIIDYEKMKSKLLATLNLEPLVPPKTPASIQPTPVDLALQLVNYHGVNRQKQSYRDAIALLEKTVEGEKLGNQEIHLALVNSEMRKFGNSDDKNFDAKYVLRHLNSCKISGQPVSIEVYWALSNTYRRLERPAEYLENIQAMVKEYPDQVWQLYEANIAVNRSSDNLALLEQECARLKERIGLEPNLAGESKFHKKLKRLASVTHNHNAVLEIFETIKKNNHSQLPSNLKNSYDALTLKKKRHLEGKHKRDLLSASLATKRSLHWTRLEQALEDGDRLSFQTQMTRLRRSGMPADLSIMEIVQFFESAMERGLTEGSALSADCVVDFLDNVVERKEQRHTALFWVARSGEKVAIQKLSARFLIQNGKYDEAIVRLEAVLDAVSEDDEARKLLEDCQKKR